MDAAGRAPSAIQYTTTAVPSFTGESKPVTVTLAGFTVTCIKLRFDVKLCHPGGQPGSLGQSDNKLIEQLYMSVFRRQMILPAERRLIDFTVGPFGFDLGPVCFSYYRDVTIKGAKYRERRHRDGQSRVKRVLGCERDTAIERPNRDESA